MWQTNPPIPFLARGSHTQSNPCAVIGLLLRKCGRSLRAAPVFPGHTSTAHQVPSHHQCGSCNQDQSVRGCSWCSPWFWVLENPGLLTPSFSKPGLVWVVQYVVGTESGGLLRSPARVTFDPPASGSMLPLPCRGIGSHAQDAERFVKVELALHPLGPTCNPNPKLLRFGRCNLNPVINAIADDAGFEG